MTRGGGPRDHGERTVGHVAVAVRMELVLVLELELAAERGRVIVGEDVDAVDHRDEHHHHDKSDRGGRDELE